MFFEKDRDSLLIEASHSALAYKNYSRCKSFEYFDLRDRVIWILLKKDVDEREVRVATQLAHLAAGYDLCYGLDQGNSISYGIVSFGLDFAAVKKDFISGYEPLRDGDEQEEDFDAFQLLHSIHHPVRKDNTSDLVQRMQGYLIEAETLHDAWEAFHVGTKEEKALSLGKICLRLKFPAYLHSEVVPIYRHLESCLQRNST
ncbi:MAG: hypothetical protein Q8R18_03595 [bacterium]|nr:hypothetical protein [bacterium]